MSQVVEFLFLDSLNNQGRFVEVSKAFINIEKKALLELGAEKRTTILTALQRLGQRNLYESYRHYFEENDRRKNSYATKQQFDYSLVVAIDFWFVLF